MDISKTSSRNFTFALELFDKHLTIALPKSAGFEGVTKHDLFLEAIPLKSLIFVATKGIDSASASFILFGQPSNSEVEITILKHER